MALVWSVPTGHPLAASLDAKAYGITAAPTAGPVRQYQPDRSLAPVPFQLPFDWGMDPFHDQTWRFRLHTLRIVDGALVAGDFDYARDVFLDWQRWHENCWWSSPLCFARASDQSWDDMATGIRASRLAYLLRATDWRDERLVELAQQHAAKLQDPAFFAGNHNHALFQLHGLAALCLDHSCSPVAGPTLSSSVSSAPCCAASSRHPACTARTLPTIIFSFSTRLRAWRHCSSHSHPS